MSDTENEFSKKALDTIPDKISGTISAESMPDTEAKDLFADNLKEAEPNETFIGSATVANLGHLKSAYKEGADVNTRHPKTGATALHYAASMRARDMLNWLAKCDGVDYLIRDNKGRLPSALAYEVADDPIIGRFLVKKQTEQARARGIDIRTLLVS